MNFGKKGLKVYSAMVTFLGNLSHFFQRLQAVKKVWHCCVLLLPVHSVACLGCLNIFPKTAVSSSNLKLGIRPKQQTHHLRTNTSITVGDSVLLISYVHKTSEPFMRAYYKHTIRFHFFLVWHLFPKNLFLG